MRPAASVRTATAPLSPGGGRVVTPRGDGVPVGKAVDSRTGSWGRGRGDDGMLLTRVEKLFIAAAVLAIVLTVGFGAGLYHALTTRDQTTAAAVQGGATA